MKKLMLLLAALAVMGAGYASAQSSYGDVKRDGEQFNPAASPQWMLVRRTVDSTGTVAGRRDSAVWYGPIMKMPLTLMTGGIYSPDTSARTFRMDNDGNVYVSVINPDKTWNDTLSTGITNLSLATAATGISSIVDLSTYSHVVLLLEWDAADSSAVAFGLKLYNKKSDDSWASFNTPAYLPAMFSPGSLADSTLTYQLTATTSRPSIYIFRNSAAPVANTYSLRSLLYTPRVIPGPAGIAINLDPFGSFDYFGFQLTNASASTVDQIKATLWVSR